MGTKSLYGAVFIAGLILFLDGPVAHLGSAGPRKDAPRNHPKYSIPAHVLAKPFSFGGEVIPLRRADVQRRICYQLNFLLFDARSVLTTWLIEKNRYAWIFEEIFKKEGIPLDFLLFAAVISNLSNKTAAGVSGAGWWAIDKPCDSSEGVIMADDSWQDDRLDVELSTKCFAARLKRIKKELGAESWLTAAAAYLTSTKTVAEMGKRWNTLQYWDLPLPENAETLIVRWIALGMIDADRNEFGLKVQGDPPLTYDQITGLVLAKDLLIAEIARMIESPPREILRLNRKIKPSQGRFPASVNGKQIAHSLAVPKGKGHDLVDKLKKNGYLIKEADR
jgi:hypothetical protein